MQDLIRLQREGNVLKVSGQVDAASAETLESWCLKEAESLAGDMVLDLSDVTFMGSSGFGVLMALRVHLLKDGKKCVIRPSEPVRDIFNIAGIAPLIDLDSVE